MTDHGIPPTITCVDCGGVAHLLSHFPADDPPRPGDTVAYRCADCLDRWDIVLDELHFGDPSQT